MAKTGVMGSTVVCFKYNNGVVMASDNSTTYGSLCLQNFKKIYKLTNNCMVGFSGNISDAQYLHQLIINEINKESRIMDPQGIHKMVQRIIYNRRSELNLLQISVIICGINLKENNHFKNATDESGKMIGVVNSKGNFWFDTYAATGIASHLILPILREEMSENLTKEEASNLMKRCMKILCYKDCNASHNIQMMWCESTGILEEKVMPLETNWELAINNNETVLQ